MNQEGQGFFYDPKSRGEIVQPWRVARVRVVDGASAFITYFGKASEHKLTMQQSNESALSPAKFRKRGDDFSPGPDTSH